MSRVPMLPPQPEDPAAAALFDGLRQALGADFQIPHLYRVLGNSPPMFKAWLDFAWPLRQQATTPRPLRELMILRGAQVSGTSYEWSHHVPMALAAGVRQLQIDALVQWRESSLFDERERAVLRLAEEVTQGPAASAEAIEALKTCGFDTSEIVELVLTASFYVCVGRFLQSMDVGLEPGHETGHEAPGFAR
jgi:alkylhydroperoxidase family enzyme